MSKVENDFIAAVAAVATRMTTTTTTTMTLSDSLNTSSSSQSSSMDYSAANEKISYEDYFDSRLPKWPSMLLLVIGLFGNLLSVLVFAQRQMRKHSTFVYLAFLCFVDLYVLLFGLGDLILISYFGLILRNKSLLVCRLHTFLTYTFTHLSSFILASVSIDRAIATNAINYAKSYCTPRVAYRVIIANCSLAVLLNFHSLLFLGYEDYHPTSTSTTNFDNQNASLSSSTTNMVSVDYTYHQSSTSSSSSSSSGMHLVYCSSEKETWYDRFLDPYFQWIDLIFYAILPFFTMAICSFFIIRAMFASNRRLKKTLNVNTSNLVTALKANNNINEQNNMNGANGHSSSNNNQETADLMEPDRQKSLLVRIGRRSTTYLVEKRRSSAAPMQGRLNKTLHLTYTLISINALFFCLVSPLAILSLMVKGKEDVREYKLMFNVVYLLAYANHSFNFVFYGLSSPPYRECILDLCSRLVSSRSTATLKSTSSSQFSTHNNNNNSKSFFQQQQRRASAAPVLTNSVNSNGMNGKPPIRSILRNGTIH